MKKKWSRRKFLEAGLVDSIAIRGATTAGLSPVREEGKTQQPTSASGALGGHDRDLPSIAMYEILPASDGMPAAGEVGGVDYLDKLAGRYKEAGKELRESLGALEALSKKHFDASFLSLSYEQRIESLTALEKSEADVFKILRDYVYEAYYTRPAVWKLIGYEFCPTNAAGPRMKPFDANLLAEVRKKPKYYREA